MGPISILLLVIFVVSALLLVVMVMIQDEGGEGLGGIFGGGGGSSQIGDRSGNILTKTTSILGALFMLTAFGLAWFNRGDTGDLEQAAAQLRGDDARVEWWTTDGEEDEGVADDEDEEVELPSVDLEDDPDIDMLDDESGDGN